jgi:hypothetical protein
MSNDTEPMQGFSAIGLLLKNLMEERFSLREVPSLVGL